MEDHASHQQVCFKCNSHEHVVHDAEKAMTLCEKCGTVLRESEVSLAPGNNVVWDEKMGACGVSVANNQTGGEVARGLVLAQSLNGAAYVPNSVRYTFFRENKSKAMSGAHTLTEDMLMECQGHIRNLSTKLKLSDDTCYEIACLVQKVQENLKQDKLHVLKPVSGAATDVIVAACAVIACRRNHVPITIKEVASAIQCSSEEILAKHVEKMKEVLKLTDVPLLDLAALLDRYAHECRDRTRLGLSEPLGDKKLFKVFKRYARHLLDFAKTRELHTGRKPVPVVVAIVHFALRIALPENSGPMGASLIERLASEFGCSTSTVFSRLKEIKAAFSDVKDFIVMQGGELPSLPMGTKATKARDVSDWYVMKFVMAMQRNASSRQQRGRRDGAGAGAKDEEGALGEREKRARLRHVPEIASSGSPSKLARLGGGGSVLCKEQVRCSLLNSEPPVMKTGRASRAKRESERCAAKVLRRVSGRFDLWKDTPLWKELEASPGGGGSEVANAFPVLNHPRCQDIISDFNYGSHLPLKQPDLALVDRVARLEHFSGLHAPAMLAGVEGGGLGALPPIEGGAGGGGGGGGMGGGGVLMIEAKTAADVDDDDVEDAEIEAFVRCEEGQKRIAAFRAHFGLDDGDKYPGTESEDAPSSEDGEPGPAMKDVSPPAAPALAFRKAAAKG